LLFSIANGKERVVMALERTLAIIKPDAMEARRAGAILARIEKEGFAVRGLRQLHLTRAQAEGFYAVHRGRPFFEELTTFMSRGPIVVMALEAEGAVSRWRDVIGATDPAKAAPDTVRKLYGKNVGENAVHGSDSTATAAMEIGYFFPGCEVPPGA
jgi:nucleoside-diphosphate kinase